MNERGLPSVPDALSLRFDGAPLVPSNLDTMEKTMKTSLLNWLGRGVILGSLISLCACGAKQTPVADTSTASGKAVSPTARAPITAKVETHKSQGEKRTVEGAQGWLLTVDSGAMMKIATNSLTPGHVYTLWVIVVNKPSACATSPCTAKDVLKATETVEADVRYGDGAVADENGNVTFTAWVDTGDWKGSWWDRGFHNPIGAEIHGVINDHGPPLEGKLAAMLTSYRTGCTDESLPPPFPDTAKADGEPGPNKCALMQDVIFQQAK